MLGPVVAALAASVLLCACGGGAKAPGSNSGSPTPSPSSSVGTRVVVFGGFLARVKPQGGALKGRTLPGGYVDVNMDRGSLLFVVRTMPKTATFQCWLYAAPQLRKVPIQVTETSTYGFKTYYVRPSKPLAPGPYQLVYGGTGRFQMSLYEIGAG